MSMSISVTRMKKIQNSSLFDKFHEELPNSDITKEALNCTVM